MATTHDETFNNHSIHARINDFLEKIDEIEPADLEKEEKDSVQRLRAVVFSLRDWLQRTDPIFIATSTLDNLSSYVNEAHNQITNYISNGAISHLHSAEGHVDQIVTNWHQLFAPRKTSDLQGIKQSVLSFRSGIDKELEEVKNAAQEKLNEIEIHAKELGTHLSDVEAKSVETTAEISAQKKRLDDAIAEFQSQFSSAESQRQKDFDTNREKRRKEDANFEKARAADFNGLIKSYEGTLSEKLKEISTAFDEKILEVRGYAAEAKITAELMSEKSLKDDFITQADKEKNRAWWWNFASFANVALLLLAIGFIFVNTFIHPFSGDPANYPQILSKFLVTAVVGVVARWTSRQANRHLAEERRLRRLALELATLNPFISALDPSVQSKIKEILAMRYYGNHTAENTPFGELEPVSSENDGLKSIPESIIDRFKTK